MEYHRARNTDPVTSWEAADDAKELAKAHSAAILKTLIKHGPLGKDGIAFFAVMDGIQVARRLPEMQRDGLVGLTGKTVKSMAKRSEREWYAIS